VIDMQPRGVGAEAGLVQAMERTAPGYTRYLTARVRATVIPNTLRLLDAFRRLRRPVYFTAFASATGNGRDVTTATIRYQDAERRARTGQSVILPRSDPATNVIPAGAAAGRSRADQDLDGRVHLDQLAEELRVSGIEPGC